MFIIKNSYISHCGKKPPPAHCAQHPIRGKKLKLPCHNKVYLKKNVNDIMSILMVRIQIYIIKWLFRGKIYNICRYRIINNDLKVNK